MSRTYSVCFSFFYVIGLILLLVNVATCFFHLNNLKGRRGDGYYVEAEVGTPPQKLNLLVDTGSSNLAVAGTAHPLVEIYFKSNRSETYVKKENVAVPYTRGCWDGELGSDMVSVPSLNNLVPVRCDVARILASKNFYLNGSRWQGILGLAYPSMSKPSSDVLTWLEAVSYVAGHNVSQYHFRSLPLPFSLELCGPYNDDLDHYGNFYVGDTLSVPGPGVPQWIFSPVVKGDHYVVLLAGIQVGGIAIELPCEVFNIGKTIVDSGTTDLKLPDMVFQKFMLLLLKNLEEKGVVLNIEFWKQKKVVCWKKGREWRERQWLESFPNLTISLAHTPYFANGYNPRTNQFHKSEEDYPFPIKSYFNLELTPRSYIQKLAPSQRSASRATENCYQFAVGKSESGTVLGMIVMEGLNIMFNQTGRVVGFAESNCGPDVRISGPFPSEFDSTPCTQLKCEPLPYSRSANTRFYLFSVISGVTAVLVFGKLIIVFINTLWFSLRYRYLLVPSKKKNASVAHLVAPDI